ncbi:MAG: hypothetical protein RL701_588 [Pseudomonadota bacterium]
MLFVQKIGGELRVDVDAHRPEHIGAGGARRRDVAVRAHNVLLETCSLQGYSRLIGRVGTASTVGSQSDGVLAVLREQVADIR